MKILHQAHRLSALFLMAALILAASATVAMAASEPIAQVEIGGTHKIENNVSLKTGRHTFVLTGEDGVPMPEGSSGNEKRVTIDSNQDFSFGTIEYVKPGTYTYTVSRDLTKSENLKEDDAVYKCNVAVFSDNTSVVVFSKVGVEGKPNKIEYTDHYIAPEKEGGKKVRTGDDPIVYAYTAAFVAAVAVLLFIFFRKKKK